MYVHGFPFKAIVLPVGQPTVCLKPQIPVGLDVLQTVYRAHMCGTVPAEDAGEVSIYLAQKDHEELGQSKEEKPCQTYICGFTVIAV